MSGLKMERFDNVFEALDLPFEAATLKILKLAESAPDGEAIKTGAGIIQELLEVKLEHYKMPENLVSLLRVELEKAHKLSDHHRTSIETGELCGCFYCEKVFDPKTTPIEEWADKGTTALCPLCGVDSVISTSDLSVASDPVFLAAMHAVWFSRAQPSHQENSSEPSL